jgi:hypothetical protein
MARSPRRRRHVSPWLLVVLKPLFRHSYSRDAYVLRVVGNRLGPVLVPGQDELPRHGVTH